MVKTHAGTGKPYDLLHDYSFWLGSVVFERILQRVGPIACDLIRGMGICANSPSGQVCTQRISEM
jgi:hypothetical protein